MENRVKAAIPFIFLQSLWEGITSYANEHDHSVSELFELTMKKLIKDPKPLPYRPNRRVSVYGKAQEYRNEFPRIRTSLWVDPVLFSQFRSVYVQFCKEQYGSNVILDNSILGHTVLYHFCTVKGIAFNKSFFDDEYFSMKYTYQDKNRDEEILKSIKELAVILGKSPTAREWNQHRRLVGGPSMTIIVNSFGTFKKAKALAFNKKGY